MQIDRQPTLITWSLSSSFLESSCAAFALQLLALSLPGASLSISMPATYQLSLKRWERSEIKMLQSGLLVCSLATPWPTYIHTVQVWNHMDAVQRLKKLWAKFLGLINIHARKLHLASYRDQTGGAKGPDLLPSVHKFVYSRSRSRDT